MYTQLIFKNINSNQQEILSALLSNFSCLGIEENDDELKAVFLSSDFDEVEIATTIAPFNFSFEKEIIAEQNWNKTWEESFEPIKIENKVAVRAHFHPMVSDVEYEIVITPKMSFGTGHHATTQLMLEKMYDLNFEQKKVLDFGSGTGVLAIFAEMLGASNIIALDNDTWCMENGKENIAQNNCLKIEAMLGSIDIVTDKKFDIILANINLNILKANAKIMFESLNENGELLLSGLLISDKHEMIESLQNAGFSVFEPKEKENWLSIYCKKS
ncbi:MAG: 50S ribosomal protein L11 methyltransferase [Chitinophagaceae bacterium]|nr:50S ribosomal protein L11 methyltransferase [Chitinophagaceae bacterium]